MLTYKSSPKVVGRFIAQAAVEAAAFKQESYDPKTARALEALMISRIPQAGVSGPVEKPKPEVVSGKLQTIIDVIGAMKGQTFTSQSIRDATGMGGKYVSWALYSLCAKGLIRETGGKAAKCKLFVGVPQ